MYAGNIGELQGLRPLVEAFGRSPDAHLVLVGDGVAKSGLQELVTRNSFDNVDIHRLSSHRIVLVCLSRHLMCKSYH